MPTSSSNWFKFKAVRRKFGKKSPERDIITVVYSDEENANLLLDAKASRLLLLTRQDVAAVTIQSHFRGHLARRAFRALRSLVKLQAMVRGAHVRKQARTALHCMHAMLRLHLTVRSRQILA